MLKDQYVHKLLIDSQPLLEQPPEQGALFPSDPNLSRDPGSAGSELLWLLYYQSRNQRKRQLLN